MEIGHNTDISDIETEASTVRINYLPLFIRYIIPLLVIILMGILWLGDFVALPFGGSTGTIDYVTVRSRIRYQGSFRRDFNDLNALQLEAARHIGIPPLTSRKGLDEVRSKLREVESNNNIHIDPLSHSIPYLVPKAHDLINEIGRRFTAKLKAHDLPLYQPIITSITRTYEDIKHLQRGNVNATEHSTHLYGTTFDISWRRYNKADDTVPGVLSPDDLKHILATVLADLREEGRCYIKHEVKQACFHITTRP